MNSLWLVLQRESISATNVSLYLAPVWLKYIYNHGAFALHLTKIYICAYSCETSATNFQQRIYKRSDVKLSLSCDMTYSLVLATHAAVSLHPALKTFLLFDWQSHFFITAQVTPTWISKEALKDVRNHRWRREVRGCVVRPQLPACGLEVEFSVNYFYVYQLQRFLGNPYSPTYY